MSEGASGPEPDDTAAADETPVSLSASFATSSRMPRPRTAPGSPGRRSTPRRWRPPPWPRRTDPPRTPARPRARTGPPSPSRTRRRRSRSSGGGHRAPTTRSWWAAPIIHEEFVAAQSAADSRSHRTGMLAGLAVVGALLVVLVVLAPGGSKPRLPAQSVHDVSPISASGPKTDGGDHADDRRADRPRRRRPPPARRRLRANSMARRSPRTSPTARCRVHDAGATVTPATTASPTPQTTAPPQTTTTTTAPPPTTTTTAPSAASSA